MRSIISLLLITFTSLSYSADPDCTGPDRFATNLAHQDLLREGLITQQIPNLDLKIERLTSSKIDSDLYRQVHKMTFNENGKKYSVITINDVSSEECSMGPVTVYLLDKKISLDYPL